jgi:hypothetical protein
MPSLIGNKPNQVPSNGDLGTLAFQDANAVNITGGVVDVSAGTAALPTLGTTGDENTGVFFPAADTVAVSTNGVERARVDSSGNLLVGATSATYSSAGRGVMEVNGSSESLIGFKRGGNGSTYIRATSSAFSIVNAENTAMTFATNETERMRITAAGGVELAQGQLKFPATQVASADANTLDDYEEGTFTPTVIGLTTAGTTTYVLQSGTYTKIGRVVTATFTVDYSAATGTGALAVRGFPFSSSANEFIGSVMCNFLNAPNSGSYSTYLSNAAGVELYSSTDDGALNAFQLSNEAAKIWGTITYFV